MRREGAGKGGIARVDGRKDEGRRGWRWGDRRKEGSE